MVVHLETIKNEKCSVYFLCILNILNISCMSLLLSSQELCPVVLISFRICNTVIFTIIKVKDFSFFF